MNKKVVIAAVGILLVASLASCGKNNGGETTTVMPALTGATQSTSGSVQTADSSAQLIATTANASPTYILTTQQGQTMATVPLTAFSLDTTTPTSSVSIPDLNDITSPSLDNPNVLTSVMPSTIPSTSEQSSSGTSNSNTPTVSTTEKKTTTTKESTTAEPTTAAKKVSKDIDIVSCGTDPNNGNFIITFDPSGWEGGVKNSTGYVTVDIDGTSFPAKASVSGTPDADGNATIKIYSSEREPADGSVITVNIGDGLVKSKNGTQESKAFSSSVEHKTP
ncbi:MAG: hypothetical protein ACI4XE_11885 [Acutalibacteraceae bacterium]